MPPQVAPTPGARVSWAATASPALKAEPEIKMEPDAQGAPPDTLAEMRASMFKGASVLVKEEQTVTDRFAPLQRPVQGHW